MPDKTPTIYLGDGLYVAAITPNDYCIYAHNGIERTNSVYLDFDMLTKAHEWARLVKETK